MPRRLWPGSRRHAFHIVQPLEELHDREAEADERDRGAQPRHERAIGGHAGAQPTKMTIRGDPHLETSARFLVRAHDSPCSGKERGRDRLRRAPSLGERYWAVPATQPFPPSAQITT